jgi:glycogen synthase
MTQPYRIHPYFNNILTAPSRAPYPISPQSLQIQLGNQNQIASYQKAAENAYQSANEMGTKLDALQHLIRDLENPRIDNDILFGTFCQQCANPLGIPQRNPLENPLLKTLCEKVSQGLSANSQSNAETGKRLLETNFRSILRIKNYDGLTLLDQLAAHFAHQLEIYRAIGKLNTIGATLEEHKSLQQRTDQLERAATLRLNATKAYEGLPGTAKEALCYRIYQLDGGGNKGSNYGNDQILANIEKLLSHQGQCPIKDALETCSHNTTRHPDLITTYVHVESIKIGDSSNVIAEIKKLYELEDLKHFIHDPYKNNDFLAAKYRNLSPEVRKLIDHTYWLARCQPDILQFSEKSISHNVRMLLDVKSEQGADIISQLISHQQEKIKGLRLVAELESFITHIDSSCILSQFNQLTEPLKNALCHRVWEKVGHKNLNLGWGWAEEQINNNPFILFSNGLITAYLSELRGSIINADEEMYRDLKTKKPVPQGPVDVSSKKLAADRGLIHEVPKDLNVALVAAELSGGGPSIGGLASAVDGIARGIGVKHAKVILPLYRSGSDNVKAGPIDHDKILQHLKPKPDYDVTVDGKKHAIFSTRINGLKCYFIDDPQLFSIPPKKDGASGNFYEGDFRNRFAVFQSAAVDLIYKLSKKEKDPINLVHLHDSQTALIPKFLAQRHPEEWKNGKTPATVFTIHNNREPMIYNDDRSVDILARHGLPRQGTNSLLEGVNYSDFTETVSDGHSKELQMPRDGNGMHVYMKQAAAEDRFAGIDNGPSNGWDPRNNEQLRTWISVLEGPNKDKPVDLRFGPDSPDLGEKIKTIRNEVCTYLRNLPYDDPAHVDLDPEKAIFEDVTRYDWSQKGIDKFMMILEEILDKGGQFVCVGLEPDSESFKMLERIQNLAKQRGKKGVLALVDERKNGKLVYQGKFGSLLRAAASFAFFPSLGEPFGLIWPEFAQLGVKAIATRTGGFATTVKTEGPDANGYLFDRVGDKVEDWFTSPLQAEKIIDAFRLALQDANATIKALYGNDEQARLQYLNQRRNIMRNALNSTWEKTPDGSLSPIDYHYFGYAKAFKHRKKRGVTTLNLKTFKV